MVLPPASIGPIASGPRIAAGDDGRRGRTGGSRSDGAPVRRRIAGAQDAWGSLACQMPRRTSSEVTARHVFSTARLAALTGLRAERTR